ncbi:MAG: hypothetical protein GY852_05175 [bacterium]|nr:hypothetical protein [bacterium]
MKVNEYAAGTSVLFKGEFAGMERAVGFVTAVGRKAREEDETLEQGRGGAGFMGRMGTVRQEKIAKGEKLGLEFGAAVEESWGDNVVGVTLAWQDAQVIKHEQYNLAIANIRQDLSNYGLVGTMHDSQDLNWFLVGDWRFLSQQARVRSGQTSYAGELGAIETEDFRIQESVLWQYMETRWSLSRVTARLHDVEAELQDLRVAGPTPEVGQTGSTQTALEGDMSVQSSIDQLEREQIVLRRMQTALGLIEAQTLFGTVAIEWDFLDDKARAGIEAIWGGPDEWAALLNSYIEVDEKFAAAFNLQPAPWGSTGGKVVIPFTGFILAMTAGEYWREDVSGPNVNVGITMDPAKAFGVGAIIGGMARWGTLEAGEESHYETTSDVDYRRNVAEGMVLGWMPWWEGSRAQGYFVYAKEWGTNTYTIQEDLDIDRLGAGARVLWVGENGIAYTVNAEWLRKKVASEIKGTGLKLMDQAKDDVGVGFEVKGADDRVGGRVRGVVSIIDRVMHDATQREDPTNYKRVEWAAFADVFFSF